MPKERPVEHPRKRPPGPRDERFKIDGDPEAVLKRLLNTPPLDEDQTPPVKGR